VPFSILYLLLASTSRDDCQWILDLGSFRLLEPTNHYDVSVPTSTSTKRSTVVCWIMHFRSTGSHPRAAGIKIKPVFCLVGLVLCFSCGRRHMASRFSSKSCPALKRTNSTTVMVNVLCCCTWCCCCGRRVTHDDEDDDSDGCFMRLLKCALWKMMMLCCCGLGLFALCGSNVFRMQSTSCNQQDSYGS